MPFNILTSSYKPNLKLSQIVCLTNPKLHLIYQPCLNISSQTNHQAIQPANNSPKS